ncbi:fibronectin type III domain-containing protein [Kribbella sp. NPDC050470]|uniref:fibronectin type III domain-containing protein n=1 Tax=unclassified Kribbella TaxID=2644121 RepID=UPI0037B52FE2
MSLRPRRLTTSPSEQSERKARAGLAAVVAGCIALTSVVVLTGAGSATSGVGFTQSGHWVYNSAIGRIFHLDGATKDVDAEVKLDTAGPGAQVVQTDKNGYVLSGSRIDQFGKSDLTVAEPIEAPVDEQPVGLEAAGAAFAVYPKAGHVMRLGEKQAAAFPGGPLGDPVVTPDGTLWVFRASQGDVCQLPLSADRMSCPASVPKGHKGGLTVLDDEVAFVDLTAQKVYRLSNDGIDERLDLSGIEVPDDALVAGNDVGGRLAIVDPGKSVVHLVEIAKGKQPAATSAPIRRGKYDKVASSGDGLALLDRKRADLVTLDRNGREVSHQQVPSRAVAGERKREPSLFRGDDSRVYVESGKGDRVVVVDRDGQTESVTVGGERPGPVPTTPTPTTTPSKTTETPKVPVRKTPPTRKTPPSKTTEPEKTTPTNQATARAGLPGAPSAVRVRAVSGAATVTWQAAAPHGATISSYRLSWTGGSMTVPGSARSARITDLAGNTGYTISVRAVNRVGAGPAVRSNRVQFNWGVAESPGGLAVRGTPSGGSLVLGWNRPQLGEGTFVRYDVSMGSQTRTTTAAQLTWTGLTAATRYTFTVRAITRSPDGRTLTGEAATVTATTQRKESVIASRGAGADYGNCEPPECAFILIRMSGLRPDTRYEIHPWTTEWGNFNPGATLTTDEKGGMVVDDRFPCNAVGQTVWVTVKAPDGTTYTSNKFVWTSS